MIHITTYPPPLSLTPFVLMMWTSHTEDSLNTEPVVTSPSGYVLLTMFTDNSRYLLKIGDQEFKITPRAALQGQLYAPVTTKAVTEVTNTIGIMFNATAVYRLWRIDMRTLTNKVVDAEQLLGEDFCSLMNLLPTLDTEEKRVAAVTEFLERKILKQHSSKLRVDNAVRLMQEKGGKITVREVADHCSITTRILERDFATQIGVSPKYLNRVIQFNRTLETLKYSPQINWAELAAKMGYYDQAHLIKAFIEFTGKTPTKHDNQDNTLTETHLAKGRHNDIIRY